MTRYFSAEIIPDNPPVLTGVSASSGPATGGTTVTITGSGLSAATAVSFGGAAATIVSDTDAQIVATSPAGTGVVDVTVTTAGGTSVSSTADQFYYVPVVTGVSPAQGSVTGGTSVTITGVGLDAATAVTFGGTAGTISSDTGTQIVAISPAGTGTVDVRVTTAGGTSATSDVGKFTYLGPDLLVVGLTVEPGSPQSGQVVTVNWTDANRGIGTPNGWTDSVVVKDSSGNTVFSGTQPAASLAAGGTEDQSLQFTLPRGWAGTGTFTATVTADANGAVTDVDPSNNVAPPCTFTSTLSTADMTDLGISSLTCTPGPAYTGDSVSLSFTVANLGYVAARGQLGRRGLPGPDRRIAGERTAGDDLSRPRRDVAALLGRSQLCAPRHAGRLRLPGRRQRRQLAAREQRNRQHGYHACDRRDSFVSCRHHGRDRHVRRHQ